MGWLDFATKQGLPFSHPRKSQRLLGKCVRMSKVCMCTEAYLASNRAIPCRWYHISMHCGQRASGRNAGLWLWSKNDCFFLRFGTLARDRASRVVSSYVHVVSL